MRLAAGQAAHKFQPFSISVLELTPAFFRRTFSLGRIDRAVF